MGKIGWWWLGNAESLKAKNKRDFKGISELGKVDVFRIMGVLE